MQAATVPVKYAGRNYVVEMFVVAALLVGATLARHWLVDHAPDRSMALAAALLPVIPIWMMLLVVWRYYRRIDEFERQRFLETIAISFGIGSCLLCTYGFLADAGMPGLARDWSWPTLMVCWALTGIVMHAARR